MKKARERRERDEHERMAAIFRDPPSLISPSGRRYRPSLIHLRQPQDVSLFDATQKTFETMLHAAVSPLNNSGSAISNGGRLGRVQKARLVALE